MNPPPYIIAEAFSTKELEEQVLLIIQDGYIPIGGVAFAPINPSTPKGEGPTFTQAMIHRSFKATLSLP